MKLKTILPVFALSAFTVVFTNCGGNTKSAATTKTTTAASTAKPEVSAAADTGKVVYPPLNKADYDAKMTYIAHGDTTGKWPVKNTPYPLDGAILPFKRVVAFYGNLYAKKMGILGEIPPKEMLAKLQGECKHWAKADPKTPVQPALHYIAVVAQGDAGKDGKYRYRMPFKQIDSVLVLAKKINAIVFLDVQVALSNIHAELPLFEKYLAMPQVHFGMDPEFSMKDGSKPGKRIGTYDAEDINYVSGFLTSMVKKYHLPPKILVVHRFTKKIGY